MANIIELKTIKSNMRFSSELLITEAFYDSKSQATDYVVWPAEVPLTQNVIDLLHKWEYTSVSCIGSEINQEKPIAQALASQKFLDIVTLQTGYNQIAEIALLHNTRNITNEVKLIKEIRKIIFLAQNTGFQMVRDKDQLKFNGNRIADHSAWTTIISIILGTLLKLPSHQLFEIAIGAILHDVGIIKLSKDISCLSFQDIEQPGLLQQHNTELIAHTLIGYQSVKSKNFSESIAKTVLEHHEHLDGSGYPKRQKGETIHPYSKIVSLAAAIETSIHVPPNSIDFLTKNQKWYEPILIKLLHENLILKPALVPK